MAVTASFWRLRWASAVGIIFLIGGQFAFAQAPQRLFVRDQKGIVLEYLSPMLGGGFIRRGTSGRWLGRVTMVANSYHFLDPTGRTIAIARPETQPSLSTTRQPLAAILDMEGHPLGTITAQ